jgi:penicillin-binding protein 1C
MKRDGWHRTVKAVALLACAGPAAAVAVFYVSLEVGSRFVELPASLERPPSEAVEFLDRSGTPLRLSPSAEGGNLLLEEIPPVVRNAVLAAEDRRFLTHAGVDLLRVVRAAYDNVRSGRIVSGASTITQQLVKVAEAGSSRPGRRGWAVKIHEAAAARALERRWSKHKILCEYLNRIDLGNLNRGLGAASAYYFGKHAGSLSEAEAALLAGIAQAPSRLNPLRRTDAARARQLTVLRRMQAFGWLDADRYERAVAQPLQFVGSRPFHAPHFVDLLRQQAAQPLAGRVLTSLDLPLQTEVEHIAKRHLRGLAQKRVGEAAVVVLSNLTGEVRALVGSSNYFAERAGQVNGAWAPRSPGSALKPFTYLLALENGVSPGTILADVPCSFDTPEGVYQPENYNKVCAGPVPMRRALANSLNIPAVRLLDAQGGSPRLVERLQYWGLSTLTRPAGHYGLGLTIGNAEVRLLELGNAYAALARLGCYAPFTMLRNDTPITPGDSPAAWLIADMLSDNAARSTAFGFYSPLRFDFRVACKTGTSTSFRDNWCFAYTPEFTVGVWAGNFDGQPMREVSGVTGAAPVAHEVMEYLHKFYGTSWYAPARGLVRVRIDPVLGRSAEQPESFWEWFPAGQIPAASRPEDFDGEGRAVLGSEYADWVRSLPAPQRYGLAAEAACRILSPRPGTVFLIDPDLQSSRLIPLKAFGSREVRWKCDTLRIKEQGGQLVAVGEAGTHRFELEDSSSGTILKTWIEIRNK